MKALRCFWKKCLVSADDFVVFGLVGTAVRLTMLCFCVVIALYTFVGLSSCKPDPRGVLIAYIFGALLIQILSLTAQWCIFVISKKGPISGEGPKQRNHLQIWLYITFILFLLEIGFCVVGGVVSWSPNLTFNDPCKENNVQQLLTGYTCLSILVVFVKAFSFLAFADPFGCCSASLIAYIEDEEKGVVISKKCLCFASEEITDHSNKALYNSVDFRWCLSTLNRCRCIKQNGNDAVQYIAKDLAILFKDECFSEHDMVPSDLVAAIILVSNDHRSILKSLKRQMREHVCQQLRAKGHISENYEYKEPVAVNMNEEWSTIQEISYFAHYAVGMYGWPMYCYTHPFTSCCRLCVKTGQFSRCCTRRERLYSVDVDASGCSIAALALTANVSKHDILYVSHHNEIFKAPFAVVLDKSRKALIIAIRGTLSLEDVLTDLSITMENVEVEGFDPSQTLVHQGMLKTAKNVYKELMEESTIVESFLNNNPDYSLTVVGHSLGAGVASVLSLLLKLNAKSLIKEDFKCYAFSPPGCVFSFPLAEYSKTFIISVVLGNDAVPNLNWRSLLLLKHSMSHRLNTCKRPKYDILYKKLLPECGGSSLHNATDISDIDANTAKAKRIVNRAFNNANAMLSLGKLQQKPVVIKHMSQAVNIVMKANHWTHRALNKSMSTRLMETIEGVDDVPAFIPGKVLRIQKEVIKERGCCRERRIDYDLTWEANEDFSVITVSQESIKCHLPNKLTDAFHYITNLPEFQHHAHNGSHANVPMMRYTKNSPESATFDV